MNHTIKTLLYLFDTQIIKTQVKKKQKQKLARIHGHNPVIIEQISIVYISPIFNRQKYFLNKFTAHPSWKQVNL